MTDEILIKEIRKICTYYSDDPLGGTSGYSLSEEQFEKLFKLFQRAVDKGREESSKEDFLNILRQERNRLLAEREVDKRNGYPPRPSVEARLLEVTELLSKLSKLGGKVKP